MRSAREAQVGKVGAEARTDRGGDSCSLWFLNFKPKPFWKQVNTLGECVGLCVGVLMGVYV